MASNRASRTERDQSGNVALIFALSGMAMVGMIGGGVEITRVVDGQAKLQSALDAGALAAAGMPDGVFTSLREITANKVTAANLQVGRGMIADSLVIVPDFALADRVTLVGELKIATIFRKSMFGGSHTIRANSTAQRAVPGQPAISPPPPPVCPVQPNPSVSPPQVSPPPPLPPPPQSPTPTTSANGCVWALNSDNEDGTLRFKSGSEMLAPRCHFYVQSPHIMSVQVERDTRLTFDGLFSKGGFECDTNCPASFASYAATRVAADPFATGLPQLSAGTCKANSGSLTGTVTLTPGTYCSNVSIKGNSTIVTMQPGIYHIQGDWKIDAAIVTGAGVTLYFDDNTTWDVGDKTVLNLTAPTTGPTAGLLMYEKYGLDNKDIRLGSGGVLNLTGIIYFPSKSLSFTSKNTASVLSSQIIGYDITFDKTNYNVKPYDGPRPPVSAPVLPPPVLIPPVSSGSGLLSNGSSEEPLVPANTGSLRSIAQGMLGWTTTQQFEIHNGAEWDGGGGFGTDGAQYFVLKKDLSQTITLPAGVTYRLQFDYRYGDSGTAADNHFIVNWDDKKLADIQPQVGTGPSPEWKRLTFPIRGTGEPITFTFSQMIGANFENGPFLDRVRVESDGTLTPPPDGCPGGLRLPTPPPPKAAVAAIPLRLIR